MIFIIVNLPIDILLHLKSFLRGSVFIALVSSSKKLFENIRKQTIYYHLPQELSYRFCLFDDLRDQIVRGIEDSRHQIELNLSETSLFHHDRTGEAEVFVKVHHAKLKNYRGDLSFLRYLQQVEFFGDIPDLSKFPIENSLLSMKLLNGNSFTTLQHSFSFIRKCEIISCQSIEDFTGLQGIPEVHIVNCNAMTYLKGLGNHQSLHIRNCRRLVSIPPLGLTNAVTLSDCASLVDVSGLLGIPSVCLNSLTKLISLSGVGNHHFIRLRECYNLEDVSSLVSCKTVIIKHCSKIRSIECLGQVPHLELYDSFRDIVLPSTFSNERLVLQLPDKKALSPVLNRTTLHRLELSRWNSLNIGSFEFLTYLKIRECDDLEDISPLMKTEETKYTNHLQYLIIECCYKLKRVEGFHSMKKISLSFCQVVSVIGLRDIDTVILKNVPRLSEVVNIENINLFVIRNRNAVLSNKNTEDLPKVFNFKNINCLILDCLFGFQSIIGKGDIERLVMLSSTVSDVTIDGRINRLEAEKCLQLSSVEKVHSVGKISLVECPQLNLPCSTIENEEKIENYAT